MWRSPLVEVAAWAAVAFVAAGIVQYSPRPVYPWCLVAGMLASWAVGTTIVQHHPQAAGLGRGSTAVAVAVGFGQAIAVVVAVVFVHRARGAEETAGPPVGLDGSAASERRGVPEKGAGLVDLLVIATVLALVLVQVVVVAKTSADDGQAVSQVVVPTVDVVVSGLLLRVTVLYSGLRPATRLALAGAVATIVYDLFAHLGGHRLAVPGDPDQVLGIVCVLLFGVAALHPSMVHTFTGARSRRRPPSSAFLGLLPLVVIPPGLWAVAHAAHIPGLPTPVLLVAGSVVAGLCLVRGGVALRLSEHLADHDSLTGLLNRRGLTRVFTRAEPHDRAALLLIDLDDFKQVNDTHGHLVGDALLVVVRDRLEHAAHHRGAVARFGGDEFVVVTTADAATTISEHVLAAVRLPVHLGDLTLHVSASIGIARDPAADLSELITRADVAMYAAKAAGRNTTRTFDPQMRTDLAHRYSLTHQVRQLLTDTPASVGTLRVYYQPLVDLTSGATIGAEALVRWDHPRLGLLAPGAFLDLVNTSGLDRELDTAVLTQIVTDLHRWQQQGEHPVPVSLNLTRSSLVDPTTATRILQALRAADLSPGLLHVEITEHEQLPDDVAVADGLRALAVAGVAIHLDDYGTGYTSLDYLRRFPISVLKLDRSVVVGVDTEGDTLIAGIAAMAVTLHVDLLAEGVETTAQRDRLVALGVRYGQGWLFARAMPADQFAAAALTPALVPAGRNGPPDFPTGTGRPIVGEAEGTGTDDVRLRPGPPGPADRSS